MKRNTTALLAGLDVLLVCLLAWLWINPQGGWREIHWQPPPAIRPELGGLSAAATGREDADVARFMAILDRPVFSPTRRPPPPPKPAVAARPDPLDSIHLYGLFSGSEGGGVIARVEGKTRRVKVSEPIGDWKLKEVRASDVVFSRGAETRVVALVQAKQAAGAPIARPAVAAPVFPAAPTAAVPAPAAPNRVSTPAAAAGSAAAPPAQSPAVAPGGKPANPFVTGATR